MTKATISKSFRQMPMTECADLLEDLMQVITAKERESALPAWQKELLDKRRASYHKNRSNTLSHAQFNAKITRTIRSMRATAKRKSR